MVFQKKRTVCPNCGANVSNTTDCEYCGSVVNPKQKESQEVRRQKESMFEVLSSSLKERNEMERKLQLPVVMDVYKHTGIVALVYGGQWARFLDGTYVTHEVNFDGYLRGKLCVLLNFVDISEEHRIFKSLKCYSLFTERRSGVIVEYCCFFSKFISDDVRDATNVLLDILWNVFNMRARSSLQCVVNVDAECNPRELSMRYRGGYRNEYATQRIIERAEARKRNKRNKRNSVILTGGILLIVITYVLWMLFWVK